MRLFLGVELPTVWREALDRGAAALKKAGVRANFTRRDNYHLTLVFLGETDRAEAGSHRYFVSDTPETFAELETLFLGEYAGGPVEQIAIETY